MGRSRDILAVSLAMRRYGQQCGDGCALKAELEPRSLPNPRPTRLD